MREPSTWDVLIVGAGPAGSTAACVLARAGFRVRLVDFCAFPRDKICGDALISDALGTLDALGLGERVRRRALEARELRVYAPSGRCVSLSGRFSSLEREAFDRILLDAAIDAGAVFSGGTSALGPVTSANRVRGARVRTAEGNGVIRARFTLLATGANATVLQAFGLNAPRRPMGVAGRAYFEAPADVAARYRYLTIAYDDRWCPGYGWIFPVPGRRFNVGVGLFAHRRRPRQDLKTFWTAFLSRFPAAADIVRTSIQLTPFRGAPLRTGLTGACFGRPGLVALGEAVATTYPATGEGIGKAMESGMLAASCVEEGLAGRLHEDLVHERFGAGFERRFGRRYQAYRAAERWLAHPLMVNLLAKRANAGRYVRRELEALLDERTEGGALFSTRGLFTALVR